MVSYTYGKQLETINDKGFGTYYYSGEKIPSPQRLCKELECDTVIILYMYEFNNEKDFKEGQS